MVKILALNQVRVVGVWLIVLVLASTCFVDTIFAGQRTAGSALAPESSARSLLDRYCIGYHNERIVFGRQDVS